MTRYCQQLYPGVKFATVDARNMKEYRDGQFAFVIFSFNGIDSVPPDDRLAIIKECHRVLKPGGLFAFSSHNIEKPVYGAFHLSNIEFTLHPIRLAREFQKYFTGWGHHLKNRKHEVFTPDYTVRNDNAHNYTLMHYYISKANQVKQLQSFGFEEVRIIDRKGAWTDATTPDTTSSWIYYLARKRRA
jgi:SAM-dependent methyltransferase